MADESAEHFVATHGSAVWTVIARLTSGVDRATREDCFQETFVEFWSLRQKRSIEFPRALLVRIATRRAIDLLRRRSVRRLRLARDDHALQEIGVDLEPVEHLMVSELSLALLAALRRLPEKQAAAFCMTQLEQLPTAEVAAALGRSPAAVAVLLRRARVALQAILVEWAPTRPVNAPVKGAKHAR